MPVGRTSVSELADNQYMWGLLLMSNRRENDRYLDVTFRVKRRGSLIIRLKTIKSRENIFCYLSFYLHCSFFGPLVIMTSTIVSLSPQINEEISSRRASR